jgi:hypothetical protein
MGKKSQRADLPVICLQYLMGAINSAAGQKVKFILPRVKSILRGDTQERFAERVIFHVQLFFSPPGVIHRRIE